MSVSVDQLSINTLRILAVEAIQKANTGHPGMPMGCAPIAYALYTKYMKYNPQNPLWLNRDRFILSAGHGSMLLYGILHLSGYDISLEDLKNFRQWESKTPGHPEFNQKLGIETTTGPLGQGFANAVGMAIAKSYLASMFNKDDIKILDHFIYGICSDGELMEGISHEAASLAGHLKLGKLIFFYDDNGISIDGKTSLAFSENIEQRFEAYGWHVEHISDVNDLSQIETALLNAQVDERPSLIITKTHIGFGSPNKQDTSSVHGSPLGSEEIKLTKKNLEWEYEESFFVPEEVKNHFEEAKKKHQQDEEEWNKLFAGYKKKYPQEAKLFLEVMSGNFGEEWISKLPTFADDGKKMATRQASGKVINAIAASLPTFIGGSADLAPSNNTFLNGFTEYSKENRSGRNFHFGIREHAMASLMNGMAMYGGVIPFGGTFLVFSDYLRPAIRLASLSKIKVIYVFTHDTIGLGEDGPTHQPVEHFAALRSIPGLIVLRPADANETASAWKFAIQHKGSPVALLLTRQGLPVLDQSKYPSSDNLFKGAYILKDADKPEIILMASGSEVELILKAAEKLESEGKKVRVVSFPSWELFEMQTEEYKNSILPKEVKARVAIEAGVAQGWHKYTGDGGKVISIEKFGASAPYEILYEKYGITVENILQTSKVLLK
ncbi:MAG: transketolase [Ignavibacteria bacterium CG08_land_8_20_14_0_20_37_9]|nr:MAG: transketolase [Ignavibacteria bacterium CG08_land_8_20_14_0_20_37_9]